MKYKVEQENGKQVLVPVQNGNDRSLSVLQQDSSPKTGQIIEIINHTVAESTVVMSDLIQELGQRGIACEFVETIEIIEED